MAPPRRRVLRVSDEDSCSEGFVDELNLAEAEAPAVQEEDDDIEVVDSPLHRNFHDGAARDDFSATANFSRAFSSSAAAFFSSENHTARTPFNVNVNSNSNPPPSDPSISNSAEFISSLPDQADASAPVASIASQYSALEAFLQTRGVRPVSQWLDACVERLAASRAGFLQLPISQQAESCFSCFLLADLNIMGTAALPPQLHTLHAMELAGPFVLQVDEVSDIGSAIRNRYKERSASASRCLKLSMTDGAQRVYGIEYRPIRELNVLSPAGLKIAVHHINIRRGLLLLVPEVVTILGGQVEYLEAARQRVVQHVNKPPRGSRNMRGTIPQSLVESASSAAWVTDQTRETARSEGQHTGHPDQLSRASAASGPTSLIANEITAERASDIRASNDKGDSSQRGIEQTSITYLSLLKKKWTSSHGASDELGRIKCVLTGVKEFHFKNMEQFRLVVYVDDGSQIASVLIHHDVVERLIGHSPGGVTTALASSHANEVIKMKENLNRFQVFLTKFEGMLLLRRDNATLPVAIEMTEGCPKHEAWLLAGRLQGSRRNVHITDAQAIELSP